MNWEKVLQECLQVGDEYGTKKKENVWYIYVKRAGEEVLYLSERNSDRNKLCRTAVKRLANKGLLFTEDLANALLSSR